MKKVSIITDSTSDLSKELLEQYDITVFPLHIHLGGKEYADGIDITPEEIYRWSDENGETPKTSALSFLPTSPSCLPPPLHNLPLSQQPLALPLGISHHQGFHNYGTQYQAFFLFSLF